MKTPDPPPDHPTTSIEDVAVDWAIRRADGLSASETAELLRWLEVDPRHAVALGDVEKTVGLLQRTREAGSAEAVQRELHARQAARRQRRHAAAWAAAGLAVAASVALAFLPILRTEQPEADAVQQTVVVRPDRQTLPDGSVVQLNAGAEIRVNFTPGRRTVELVRGGALFSVIADAARPFVVAASGVEVRAVGTEFLVRHTAAVVDVLVTEGRVAVAQTGPVPPAEAGTASAPIAAMEPVYVAAGGRVSLPIAEPVPTAIAVQQVTPTEMAGALAWRDQRIEFTGTPLGEAVALFNAENATQIAVDELGIESLRVGGIFWKNDPEAFARLLEMSFSLKAEHPAPGRIVLRRAQ
jgi:transmembrane sensor